MDYWKKIDNDFIETIFNESYSTVHKRCLNHDGCIVDVGCLTWDWSQYFIGKKRIIGLDPYENKIEGTDFYKGILGPFDGKTYMTNKILGSSIFLSEEKTDEIDVISWKTFCKLFEIDQISILKINIEGSEYPVLNSLDSDDYKKIDQIVVSFHDWINPNWVELTKSSLKLLEYNNFKIMKIHDIFNWYLALK